MGEKNNCAGSSTRVMTADNKELGLGLETGDYCNLNYVALPSSNPFLAPQMEIDECSLDIGGRALTAIGYVEHRCTRSFKATKYGHHPDPDHSEVGRKETLSIVIRNRPYIRIEWEGADSECDVVGSGRVGVGERMRCACGH